MDSSKQILLFSTPLRLLEARSLAPDVPYELHDLCDFLASVANPCISPKGLATLLDIALADLLFGCPKFASRVPFPKELILKRDNFSDVINLFPIIIDRIASAEFSSEFRKHFKAIFEPLPES